MTDAPSDPNPEQAPSSSPEPAHPEAEAPSRRCSPKHRRPLPPPRPPAHRRATAAGRVWRDHGAVGQPTRPAPVGVIAALAVGALVGGVSGAGVGIWAVTSNTGIPGHAETRHPRR